MESDIDMTAGLCLPDLLSHCLSQRPAVLDREVHDGGDTASRCRPGPAFEVIGGPLFADAGLEVGVYVDSAWQYQ